MAKVTVEDCLNVIPNRFVLVLAAVARARELQRGAAPIVTPKPMEKHTVTALREIASGQFTPQKLAQLGAHRGD